MSTRRIGQRNGSLVRIGMTEHEARFRLAAGFVLLSGILSLLISFDRSDRHTEAARASGAVTTGVERAEVAAFIIGDPKRPVTKADNRAAAPELTTEDLPTDVTGKPAAYDVSNQGGDMVAEAHAPLIELIVKKGEAWNDRIPELLGPHPWPTLLLGMGIGYLLARRRL